MSNSTLEGQLTDSEIIANLIQTKIDSGSSIDEAIKFVCETKLYGTWRLAILGQNKVYLATNSGDFYIGKKDNRLVFSSEASISDELVGFNFEKLKKNCLVQIGFDSLLLEETPLIKKIEIPAKT